MEKLTMRRFYAEVFKFAKESNVSLEGLAEQALQQIEEKKYDTEFLDAGIKDVVRIGIAFRGKNAVVKSR